MCEMIDDEIIKVLGAYPLEGCCFNIIRRPLSGGKGSIVRHKATKNKPEESKPAFYARLGEVIKEDPANFFMRWQIGVSKVDIGEFKQKTLNPLLERLCDWHECLTQCSGDIWTGCKKHGQVHYVMPFGCYSSLLDGGSTPYDNNIQTGSRIGLRQVEKVFPELAN
jgi:hypothetical protein